MGCHALCEDMEEDDREFLAAAEEDAALVANLLIRLSRSETCAPWRQLWEPTPQATTTTTEAEDAGPALPEPPEWGTRRARSRCITMEGIRETKEDAARRASPTTPLSWSGGSWTSGSVSESTPSRPSKRRQTPDSSPGQKATAAAAAACVHDLEPAPVNRAKREPHERRDQEQGPAPACKWRKTEAACKEREPHSVLVRGEPAAVGSSSGSGSGKQAVVASTLPVRGAPGPGAHVEPLRLAGEGSSSVVVRRPGKKKTVPELKALEASLLQEQEELRKELEEQKKIYEALSEENMKLKSLDVDPDRTLLLRPLVLYNCSAASLACARACRTVDESTVAPPVREEAASGEEPQTGEGRSSEAETPTQLLCTSPSTAVPQRASLFDLNCPPDDDDLF